VVRKQIGKPGGMGIRMAGTQQACNHAMYLACPHNQIDGLQQLREALERRWLTGTLIHSRFLYGS
jgi:hypothetical protein